MNFKSIEWLAEEQALRLLDQRRIPEALAYVTCRTPDEVAEAMREMVVRGAPASAIAGAYGLALAACRSADGSFGEMVTAVARADSLLRAARPTAVNLAWAIDEMARRAPPEAAVDTESYGRALIEAAHALAREDVETNRAIGEAAQALLPEEASVIHHCNTGAIATVDYGTALGAIRIAHERGKRIFVYVDETRPRLQGARLTAWELDQFAIPYRLIVDGASGDVMRRFDIDCVLVGCDRVAANGDVANKIGTYNLALAARAHGVPFYVATPLSTIDLATPNGDVIPIEERAAEEITMVGRERVAPPDAGVYNPAFDITPAEYVSAFITEKGIVRPPYGRALAALFEAAAA